MIEKVHGLMIFVPALLLSVRKLLPILAFNFDIWLIELSRKSGNGIENEGASRPRGSGMGDPVEAAGSPGYRQLPYEVTGKYWPISHIYVFSIIR